MSNLRITLLGQVRVAHADLETPVKVTPTLLMLLAYLLLQRRHSHPRETLAGLFWGEHSQERARSCLSTALWRLRQVLEPDGITRGTYLQTMASGEVGFNPASDYWLDVAVFEEQSNRVLAKPADAMDTADADMLENALQLYTGDLLEGFYDDWVLREQERLRRLYLNCLAHLVQYYKHSKAYQHALICGQKILNHDPIREEIHREMMRLYLASGQRALAVRQYDLCCQILAAELGISPMEETRSLHTQIVEEAANGRAAASLAHMSASYPQALQQLRQAMQSFDEARAQLQRAIQLVERYKERPDQ